MNSTDTQSKLSPTDYQILHEQFAKYENYVKKTRVSKKEKGTVTESRFKHAGEMLTEFRLDMESMQEKLDAGKLFWGGNNEQKNSINLLNNLFNNK